MVFVYKFLPLFHILSQPNPTPFLLLYRSACQPTPCTTFTKFRTASLPNRNWDASCAQRWQGCHHCAQRWQGCHNPLVLWLLWSGPVDKLAVSCFLDVCCWFEPSLGIILGREKGSSQGLNDVLRYWLTQSFSQEPVNCGLFITAMWWKYVNWNLGFFKIHFKVVYTVRHNRILIEIHQVLCT